MPTVTAPPRPEATQAPARWSTVAALTGALVGALVLLAVRDPHVPGSYGICPSLAFGFACAGCGGLRATHELLSGDLAAAWAYNPLAPLLLAAVVAILVRWGLDARAARPAWSPSGAMIAWFAGVLVTYAVVRNLEPFAAYLGPLALG